MNWLHTATIVFHVLIAAAIVGLVLLQRGKGADAGAGFGAGASGTVFGARGSASFLSRMTATLAALFFASSLTLAYLGGRRPEAPKSVIDRVTVPQTQTQEPPPAPTTQQQAPPDNGADQPVEAPGAPANNTGNDAQTGQTPQQ
jgi:preprotein translocase subunit SecG